MKDEMNFRKLEIIILEMVNSNGEQALKNTSVRFVRQNFFYNYVKINKKN